MSGSKSGSSKKLVSNKKGDAIGEDGKKKKKTIFIKLDNYLTEDEEKIWRAEAVKDEPEGTMHYLRYKFIKDKLRLENIRKQQEEDRQKLVEMF